MPHPLEVQLKIANITSLAAHSQNVKLCKVTGHKDSTLYHAKPYPNTQRFTTMARSNTDLLLHVAHDHGFDCHASPIGEGVEVIVPAHNFEQTGSVLIEYARTLGQLLEAMGY